MVAGGRDVPTATASAPLEFRVGCCSKPPQSILEPNTRYQVRPQAVAWMPKLGLLTAHSLILIKC